MRKGIKTKKKIAEAFKNLMIEKSFEDIRVQDITDLCNLTRLTFYYHYQDKYDLLNKIFYMEIIEPVRGNIDLNTWPDILMKSLKSMRRSKKYYIRAMSIRSEEYKKNLFDIAKMIMHETIIKISESEFVNPSDINFLSGFFAYGLSGMIHEWCINGMKEEPSWLVAESVHILEDMRRFAVVRYFTKDKDKK